MTPVARKGKAKPTLKRRGRGRPATPRETVQRLMRAVCERVAGGTLVIHAAEAEGIDARRIREWALDPEYAPLYARARDSQAHAMAEQVINISDGTDSLTQFYEEAADAALDAAQTDAQKQAARLLASNVIARDRLRVDSRKWMTSKISKTYADRVDLTSLGEKLPAGVLAVPVPLNAAAWGTIAAAQQAGVRGIAPE